MTPDGKEILKQAESGDELACRIVKLHAMHHRCPQDPGAAGLFNAALKEWRQREQQKKEK